MRVRCRPSNTCNKHLRLGNLPTAFAIRFVLPHMRIEKSAAETTMPPTNPLTVEFQQVLFTNRPNPSGHPKRVVLHMKSLVQK